MNFITIFGCLTGDASAYLIFVKDAKDGVRVIFFARIWRSEEEASQEVLEMKVLKCEQCESVFKSVNGLKIHVDKAHKKWTQSHQPLMIKAFPAEQTIPPLPPLGHQQLPLLDTSKEE